MAAVETAPDRRDSDEAEARVRRRVMADAVEAPRGEMRRPLPPGVATGVAPGSAAQTVVVEPSDAAAANRAAAPAKPAEGAERLTKTLSAGQQHFAQTFAGKLLQAPAGSANWRAVDVPGGANVIDFAIVNQSIWLLLPGGRVQHSADLGENWAAPVDSGARDAARILFTDARAGEIVTRSGQRFATSDAGKSWRKQ